MLIHIPRVRVGFFKNNVYVLNGDLNRHAATLRPDKLRVILRRREKIPADFNSRPVIPRVEFAIIRLLDFTLLIHNS